jgi:hypothetical protein
MTSCWICCGALEDVVGLLNAFGGSGYGQTLGFSSV